MKLNKIFWEAIENFPIFLALPMAVHLRVTAMSDLALLTLVSGWLGTTLSIHFLEPFKTGYRPALKESANNALVLGLALAIGFGYFVNTSAGWQDVVLGGLLGVGVAVGESFGWPDKSMLARHCLALGLCGCVGVPFIRLTAALPFALLLIAIIVMTIVVSVVIAHIDYA